MRRPSRRTISTCAALSALPAQVARGSPLACAGGRRPMVGGGGPEQLKARKPDSARLTTLSAQLGAAGYFIFTLAPQDTSCFTESRMFCPALGIRSEERRVG